MSFIKLLSYIIPTYKICGRVAQLVEHYLDMVVVDGSSPFVATTFTRMVLSLFYLYLFPKKAFIQLYDNKCSYIHYRRIDKNKNIDHT